METMFVFIIILFSSLIFSMLGVGGAVFYIPFFYGTGMQFLDAVTTALLLNIVTSGSASILYLRKKLVDMQVALPLIFFAAIGTQIGGYIARLAPVDLLLLLFSIQMVIIGLEMLFSRFEDFYKGKELADQTQKYLIISGGFIIGILSGLLGIGGGSFVVPMLIIMGHDVKKAAATSGFVVVFASLSAFLSHMPLWEPDRILVFYMVVASFLGAHLGSKLMYSKINANTLKKFLGILLLLMAMKILYGFL